MSALIIYHQRRQDGAERTGVEIDGDSVLERFTGGPEADNPALVWYIDLRCEGDGVPADLQSARRWLREHACEFTGALHRAAEQISAGIDADIWPYQHDAGLIAGTPTKVVCSAMRRVDARELARHLTEWAEQWERLLDELAPVAPIRG